ncbi:cysteine--tRNA ligase [Saccharophagus degradans]|uniref:cysteine--tRNA ligase n=1 Tax=Saccharophagus degradans TaxID=86304 RepID=UPI001C082973|nr:cysteine--tRNA ligase [Saccharophagus degradans]MBU2985578.1 cysteine--tRNA ligase [Saccharophagus degradans]
MSLTVYNTRTRKKEPFVPVNPQSVKMYVCGPTVYNLVHIGNARPVVVFDVLFRVLKTLYPEVVYARNITDIDDKIMKAAKENGESIDALTARFTEAYIEDMAALHNLPPSIAPKATAHIEPMIAMVAALVEKGHAYEADGHVLFDVQSMENYGKLSNRALEDMLDGARVEVADYKRYAGDFVLWKPSADDEPGWASPWGRGRPGWHLECSAMIETHLGNTIDIHGGGRDLIFPHHENELAQSECAHGGEEYVRYWMHNGYVNIDGEKMSKSLGNFRTVRDLLQQYHGETIRFALLSAQYRSELDFSVSLLDQSKAGLDTLYGALKNAPATSTDAVDLSDNAGYLALLDDLNTPQVIAELHRLAKIVNKNEGQEAAIAAAQLQALGGLLGLLQQEPEAWFKATTSGSSELSAEDIEQLIVERKEAKLAKNYARADEIRKELTEKGIALEDSASGTSWKRI